MNDCNTSICHSPVECMKDNDDNMSEQPDGKGMTYIGNYLPGLIIIMSVVAFTLLVIIVICTLKRKEGVEGVEGEDEGVEGDEGEDEEVGGNNQIPPFVIEMHRSIESLGSHREEDTIGTCKSDDGSEISVEMN